MDLQTLSTQSLSGALKFISETYYLLGYKAGTIVKASPKIDADHAFATASQNFIPPAQELRIASQFYDVKELVKKFMKNGFVDGAGGHHMQ